MYIYISLSLSLPLSLSLSLSLSLYIFLTWGHCALQSNSMKAPQFTAEFRKYKENFIKHVAGYTTVN